MSVSVLSQPSRAFVLWVSGDRPENSPDLLEDSAPFLRMSAPAEPGPMESGRIAREAKRQAMKRRAYQQRKNGTADRGESAASGV
jgi:hypothetical protein